MPDETTNTETPVIAEVPGVPVVAEPTIVPEQEPVAVIEPIVESTSLGTPEEVSATRIDVFSGAPLLGNIDSPVVAEAQVVPVPESLISVQAEPVVEAVVSIVTEPVQTLEQIAETAQPSVLVPVGDLGLTPQSTPNEALSSKIVPITTEIQLVEPVATVVPIAPEPARAPARPAPDPMKTPVRPHGFVINLFVKGRAAIEARKRNKLDRIMGLFAKQASVTNDDAEKLLHISDATASRYLGILEKEGKVKQVGTAGRWVSYVKAG